MPGITTGGPETPDSLTLIGPSCPTVTGPCAPQLCPALSAPARFVFLILQQEFLDLLLHQSPVKDRPGGPAGCTALSPQGRDLPSLSPTCSSCAELRCARRVAAWLGGPAREGTVGTLSPVPNSWTATSNPYHFLERQAAAVAQQWDEGSSALSPAGRRDGAMTMSLLLPLVSPRPPCWRASYCSPVPCLLLHQRGL